MRFDVYGRVRLEVSRHTDGYRIYELGSAGKRRLREDLVLPPGLPDVDIEQALDELLHEMGGPGRTVRRIDGGRSA